MYRIVLLRAKVNNTWKHEGRGCIDSRLHICCFGSVNEAACLVLGGVFHARVCVAGPHSRWSLSARSCLTSCCCDPLAPSVALGREKVRRNGMCPLLFVHRRRQKRMRSWAICNFSRVKFIILSSFCQPDALTSPKKRNSCPRSTQVTADAYLIKWGKESTHLGTWKYCMCLEGWQQF